MTAVTTPRRLAAALALLGLLAGLAILILPVEAAFAGDPLLRLHALGSPSSTATSAVRCGSALANLARRDDGLSLYALAQDRACRAAASRRVATAVAAVAVVGALGAVAAAGPRLRVAPA